MDKFSLIGLISMALFFGLLTIALHESTILSNSISKLQVCSEINQEMINLAFDQNKFNQNEFNYLQGKFDFCMIEKQQYDKKFWVLK